MFPDAVAGVRVGKGVAVGGMEVEVARGGTGVELGGINVGEGMKGRSVGEGRVEIGRLQPARSRPETSSEIKIDQDLVREIGCLVDIDLPLSERSTLNHIIRRCFNGCCSRNPTPTLPKSAGFGEGVPAKNAPGRARF
jgi:hypothetical protein